MTIQRLSKSLCSCLLFIFLCSFGLSAHAEGFDYQHGAGYWGGSDDDTILIEDDADMKISYTSAIKVACKSLIGLDIDKFFSGGKNKRSAVIRHLNDLAERSHYYFRLDQEEVAFKFTLNL